ncbi:hypothetical protein GN958_ATG21689 [Phytophthora infestans]|uniref:Transmembrane protein n=1 Tax=Phytophthora infestans TaxID=4787 RepID=A0A8S9TRF7_PHYIN|nr:hypothetical protein GN958_ATG21689 [Phytophthora infestans]
MLCTLSVASRASWYSHSCSAHVTRRVAGSPAGTAVVVTSRGFVAYVSVSLRGNVLAVRAASLSLRRGGTGVTTVAVLRRFFVVMGTPSLAPVLYVVTAISFVATVAVVVTGAIQFVSSGTACVVSLSIACTVLLGVRLPLPVVLGTGIASSSSLSPCLSS